ncbi:Uncharacterised protein [Bacteroides heparinolyticus]|uniref:Uncharacterized protein n=1 Tax=Prevotella heparinolytica TaxID=28113 RepID=A0A449I6T2_9BACE|nr:four helix bundle protein [Bacteroides heparinolyticus]VFB15120.1 Uncharacterised protein [Bacteroides heparinolyticus]
MANYDHLPVYKAAYDLLQCIYREMGHVPRDVKFTLVETLKNELMEMIVLIYKANATTDKCRHIEAARELTVSTKVRLRLMRERLAEVEGRCKDAKTPPPPHELERMLSVANSYCGYLRQFRAHRLAERLFGKSPLKRFFRIEGDHRKMVPKKRSGCRILSLAREERAKRDLRLLRQADCVQGG